MIKRRKLLLYTHGFVGGGAERVVARLASGFHARGDEVIMVVDFEARESLEFLNKDIELVVLPSGHLRAIWALARLLRQRPPDIALSALSISNLKLALAALISGCRRQIIMSYHGFFENEPQPLSRLSYRLTPILSRLVGATVAVSNSLRSDLIYRFSVPPDRIFTVYNPATPDPFPQTPSQAELAARPPAILAIGRLVPEKGFITLIQAFAQLRHTDARLTILGEGPQRQALEAEAQRQGVKDRFSLPGYCKDTDRYMQQTKCFVVASQFETFNLVCVEALSNGLPVVTTDCGGAVEVLDNQAATKPVPTSNPPAMAAAIDGALDQPGDPLPRQQRAKNFSLDHALDGYEGVIKYVNRIRIGEV